MPRKAAGSVTPFGKKRHRSLSPQERAKEKAMLQRLNRMRIAKLTKRRKAEKKLQRTRRRKPATAAQKRAARLKRLLAPNPVFPEDLQ